MIAGVSGMIAAKCRFWFGGFFLLFTCGGLESLSSAEVLCVEGRALIKFIGSIL